jgi:hypothetical protein
LKALSNTHFGAPVGYVGQGHPNPRMGTLQQSLAGAQMMVCGVFGPTSNAHSPDEILQVPGRMRLTAAVAQVIPA